MNMYLYLGGNENAAVCEWEGPEGHFPHNRADSTHNSKCAEWVLLWTEQPVLLWEPSLREGDYLQLFKILKQINKHHTTKKLSRPSGNSTAAPASPQASPTPRTRGGAATASAQRPSPGSPPQAPITLHPPEHFVIHGFECAGGFAQGGHGSSEGRAAAAAAGAPRTSGARTGAREAQVYRVSGRLTCGWGGHGAPRRAASVRGELPTAAGGNIALPVRGSTADSEG